MEVKRVESMKYHRSSKELREKGEKKARSGGMKQPVTTN
jgi:hypothetical protein